jgi:Transposase DDE domain group 1
MQTECSANDIDFGRAGGRRVVADFDGGMVSSDAGALLLGETDKAISLVERFSACFRDQRNPIYVVHEIETLVAQRVFGLALGDEDLLDHDELRRDPVLGVLLGKLDSRVDEPAPLAGKSTLNRLEHAPADGKRTRYHKIGHDGAAIEKLFVDLFLDAHAKPPREIVLDLDATDDPLHGDQEGRFFHGYYDCYCDLPLYVFCGRHLLAAKLRRSNIDASAGSVEEMDRIVRQIRVRWHKAKIVLRADSGFAREALMAWCEENRVDYVFGLARNARLEGRISAALAKGKGMSEAGGGKPARVFRDFLWTTKDSWSRRRRVIVRRNGQAAGPIRALSSPP